MSSFTAAVSCWVQRRAADGGFARAIGEGEDLLVEVGVADAVDD
jgi:hypothetical protein